LNPGKVFSLIEPSLETQLQDYFDLAILYKNRLVDIQRHVAWLIKRHVKDKEVKAALFQCKTMEEIVEVLKLRVQVNIVLGANPNANLRLREEPTDAKGIKRAAKKARQMERKLADKKRAREEKRALEEQAEGTNNDNTNNNDNNANNAKRLQISEEK
jgi:hypothetical protein